MTDLTVPFGPDEQPRRKYSGAEFLLGRQERDQTLARIFNQSVAVDPELAAEARTLGIETGLEPDTVSRNIEKIRLLARQKQLKRADLARTSPVLARQFLDPDFARLAHDDVDNLGALEGIVNGFNRGWLENELATLHNQQAGGDTSPELQGRIAELSQRLQVMPSVPAFSFGQVFSDPVDALRAVVFGGSQLVGQLLPSLRDAAPEAAAGAVVGSLIPGIGTALGASVAGGTELFRQFFIQERGSSYATLRNDLELDHDTAALISFGVGGVNAALEFWGTYLLAKPAKLGLKQLVKGRVDQVVRDLTMGRAVRRFALDTVKSAGGEAMTEALQEISNIIGEEVALHLSGDENALDNAAKRPAFLTRITDITQQAFGAALLLGGTGAGVRFAADMQRVKAAEQSEKFMRSLEAGTQNSKVAARANDMFQRFMARLSRGQPVENLYFDAERFDEALQQAGISRTALRGVLPEVEAQIDEAKQNGADVVIPTSEYASKVIRVSPLHEALKQEARISPDHPSLRQVGEQQSAAEQLAEHAQKTLEKHVKLADEFAESARRVERSVLEQIKTTQRISPTEARTAATIFRNWVTVLAERRNKLPHEIAEEFPFRVLAEAPTAEEALQQLLVRPRIDAFRALSDDELLQKLDESYERNAPQKEIDDLETELAHRTVDIDEAETLPTEGPIQELETTGLGVEELVRQAAQRYRDEGMSPEEIGRQIRADADIAVMSGLSPREDVSDAELGQEALDALTEHEERLERMRSRLTRATQRLQQPVSTRVPTGVKAVENPRLTALTVDVNVALNDKNTLPKNAKTMRGLPFLRTTEDMTDEQVVEAYITHVAENLQWLFDQMPAELRAVAAQWYDGGNRYVKHWAKTYGLSDQQVAAVVAVMSPQNEWDNNMSMAQRVMDIVLNQDKWTPEMSERARATKLPIPIPKDPSTKQFAFALEDVEGKSLSELEGLQAAYWIRLFDQTHNERPFNRLSPKGAVVGEGTMISWKSYPSIAKALSVIRDGSMDNVFQQLGNEVKVRSFYNNLVDPNSPMQDVTVDTHAVVAAYMVSIAAEVNNDLLIQAWGGKGGATSRMTGHKGFYPFIAEAYRRVALEKGMHARQVQSITWEQARTMFSAVLKRNTEKNNAINAAWARYKAGDITAAEARSAVLEVTGSGPVVWEGVEGEDLGDTYEGRARDEHVDRRAAAAGPPEIGVAARPNLNPELLAEWDAMSDEQQTRAAKEVLTNVVELVSLEFGVDAELVEQRGAWMGEPEASFSVSLSSPQNSVAFASMLGEMLHQEGMFLASWTPDQGMQDGGVVEIRLPEGMTTTEIDALYRDTLWPIKVDGDRVVVGHSTREGRMLIGVHPVFSPVTADQLADMLAELLDGRFKIRRVGLYSRFLEHGTDYGRATTGREQADRPGAGSPTETRADRVSRQTDTIYRAAIDRATGREPSLAQPGEPSAAARGEFFPRQLTTVLHEGADFSTVVHEMSHFFFEVHERILAAPDAPQALIDDFDTFLSWTGVESMDAWRAMSFEERRPHTEAFAFAFEQYLFEGVAPSTRMARLFDKVRRFMVRVYGDIVAVLNPIYRERFGRDLPVLTDEMRGVFGRMVAAEQEVRRADAVRAFAPLFETREEAGMSEEEWDGYLEALDEARESAITDVTQASLKQMQWLSRARGKALKRLQTKRDKLRRTMAKEIEAEVQQRPVYRALRYLRRGELDLADGGVAPVEGVHRLATEEVRAFLPEGATLRDVAGLTTQVGLHPDVIAPMFGYESGRAFVEDLVRAKPLEQEVQDQADAQMLREHSELMTPEALELEVQRALHNDARARFVAVELGFLQRAQQPVRVLTGAAKIAAKRILGRKRVRDIRPSDFAAAETRARRAAEAAVKKGDSRAAITAKHQELLQHYLAKEALEARRNLEKAERFFAKFRKTDKQLASTRNIDYIGIARAVLFKHGLGNEPTDKAPHLAQVETYAPELLEDLRPLIEAALSNDIHWRDLPLEDYYIVEDTVRALWFQARRDRLMEIEGEKVEREGVVIELLDALKAPEAVRRGRTLTPGERRRLDFGSLVTWFKHVESWAIHRDGGTPGTIHRYLFNILREPVNAYESEKLALSRELYRRINTHTFGNPRRSVKSDLLNFEFRNKAELVGALLHAGNESNLRRLLLGHQMVPQPETRGGPINTKAWWDAIDDFVERGVLTKEDFDLVQHIWDIYDNLLPRSQNAHFDVYGYRFEVIPKVPIVTKWGTYNGGYVPLKYDPHEAPEFFRDDPLLSSSSEYQRSFPSTGRGFTFTRVEEFVAPLILDVRMSAHALDEHLRFIHLQRAGRDVLRLIRDPRVKDALNRLDPALVEDMFIPWIGTTLKNRITAPGGPRVLTNFLSMLRRRTGVSIMFGNLTVGVQQLTGLGSSLAYVRLPFLRSAAALYMRNLVNGKLVDHIRGLSEFMDLRLGKGVGQIRDDIDVLLAPTWVNRAEQWTLEHGYFLQRWFQIPVDVITWQGRYEQSLSEGRTEKQAVVDADAAVRRSQGSGQVADLSRIEKGHAAARLVMQFSSFWIAMSNAVLNRPTARERIAAGAMVVAFAGLTAGVVTQALRGGWEDEDDDGVLWDDVATWAFGESLQAAVSVVAPSFGPNLLNPLTGEFGGRITMGAGVGALERGIRGIGAPFRALLNATNDKAAVSSRDVRDVGTLIALALGLPVTVVTDRLRFLMDEDEESARARGVLVGR